MGSIPPDYWGRFLLILSGAGQTLLIVGVSLAIGLVTGTLMALARLSRNWLIGGFAYAYVFVFRGTPLLVQIFLIYYGLSQFDLIRDSFLWTFFREPFWCAILAFVMNTTAYTAEIVRGGLQSVPHGQVEAARATGMSQLLIFRRIRLPVAIRQAIPAYGNEVILMVKASSLASTITIMEITGVANRIISRTYDVVPTFIMAGALYLLFNWVATEIMRFVEYRLTPYLRRRGDDGRGAPLIERYLARPLGLGARRLA